MATVREKLDFLASVKTQKQYFKLAKKAKGIAFDVASGKTYQYINLRQIISKKLNAEGISRKEIARAIGIHSSSITNYLEGRRGLPYPYMERILGILFGESDFVDKFAMKEAAKKAEKTPIADPNNTIR